VQGTAVRNNRQAFAYRELILLEGTPTVFHGTLNVTNGLGPVDGRDFGSFTETYATAANASTDRQNMVIRNIQYNVNWRRVNDQIILDYSVRNWRETITTPGGVYTLDQNQSYFNMSFIQHNRPGISYYRGDISARFVYTMGAGDGLTTVIVEQQGSVFGYDSAWSSSEAHRIDVSVSRDDWQMTYQLRPSVSVGKTLQYVENEPTAISFRGNYREVTANISGIEYDIFIRPTSMNYAPRNGMVSIDTYNTFEQLPAPDLSFLYGHPAHDDIAMLFAMQVLEGPAHFYQPAQAMTRGEFVTALVKAIKLPIPPPPTNNRRNAPIPLMFPDVTQERPEFPYIMAAYNAGLAMGRTNGFFDIDAPIERQEAFVILIRALGLENLGLNPTVVTPYVDDSAIGAWARRNIYAATRLGIIRPDADGMLHPRSELTKAQGAALLIHLLDYMRHSLVMDYTEHIVNYVR
jgi:hypothetical protein